MPAPFQELFRQGASDPGDGRRLPANDQLLDGCGLHEAGLRHSSSLAHRLSHKGAIHMPIGARAVLLELSTWVSRFGAPLLHRTVAVARDERLVTDQRPFPCA